jgi:hypothetical protein
MKKKRLLVIMGLLLLTSLVSGIVLANTLSPTVNSLTLVTPVDCPPSGCAAGQRLNFDFVYSVAPVYTAGTNVQVCAYTPSSGGGTTPWADASSFLIDLEGWYSIKPYTAGEKATICSLNKPANMVFLGGAYATLPTGSTIDSLGFAFRIKSTTTTNGTISLYVFEMNSTGTAWAATGDHPSQTFTVIPATSPAFVASDPIACGNSSPCYMDSGDDLADGIGTGLKDAVDALPDSAIINVLGFYSTKEQTVLLNRNQTIQGSGDATIFAGGSDCLYPVLSITDNVTLKNLNIDGAACPRDLVNINTTGNVLIESNDLKNGIDAVHIANNGGSLIIRYNQMTSNSGLAVNRATNSGNGSLLIVANNLIGNGSGKIVECNSQGKANHNFWGPGIMPTAAVSNCDVTDGKRLGAAINHNLNSPGVTANRVTVTQNKQDILQQGLSLKHDPGVGDFVIYAVNHGYGSPDKIPFFGYGTSYLSPCSSFWDLFLAEGASPTSLDIYLKYDLNSSCVAIIESSSYCGQTLDTTKYPLWWFDPGSSSTTGWITTGKGVNGGPGQDTSCLQSSKEILVKLDDIGRPSLNGDFQFIPLVVGTNIPVTFHDFSLTSTIGRVLVKWETTAENDISGFYVVRSEQPAGNYSRTSSLIASKGSPIIGGIYSYEDTNLSFGTNYYYKLEIIGNIGQTVGFYGPISAITATATPTITYTPTKTRTPTRTLTFTITVTRTNTPKPTITRTATTHYFVVTFTRTPVFVASITPSPLSLFTRTLTPSRSTTATIGTPAKTQTPNKLTPGTQEAYPPPGDGIKTSTRVTGTGKGSYPAPGTGTSEEQHPGQSEGTMEVNTTPQLTLTSDSQVTPTQPSSEVLKNNQPMFWVSLVGGTVLGIIFLTAIGWFFFQRRFTQ